MGVKIADKLEQFNNGTYYLVDSSAVEYVDKDGNTKSVKEALDSTPTDDSTHKTVIFENNIDMCKYLLLAKITDANYSNNIIKFSCPNYKGATDAGFNYEDDMDIYKFELHFNTGSRKENNGYGVTLKQHGLGLYSYPLNNPQNTSPKIEEAIRLYWDYSKGDIYVFLVDLMTAIPHCVLEYTGSGTLLRKDTFVNDDLYNRRDGINGTWENSKWSSIPFNKLETPPIHELGGGGGSAEGTATFTSLSELGLTADATFQDVIDALPKGGSALLGVKEFTNYQTIFQYEEGNDQFARVYIVKGLEDGSCTYARWFRKDGIKEAIAIFNINDNKFSGWQKIATQKDLDELFQSVSNGKTLVANAITGKGVSTSTTATFATMATNISKIKGYKEETKYGSSPMPRETTLTVKFSANVIGIKEIIPPSDDSYLTSEEMFRIEDENIYIRVSGEGTWEVTALIEA